MQLYARFRTASDEEGEYGMCRIFVEMGEAYLPLIVERRAGDATPIIIQVTSAHTAQSRRHPTTANARAILQSVLRRQDRFRRCALAH